VAESFQII